MFSNQDLRQVNPLFIIQTQGQFGDHQECFLLESQRFQQNWKPLISWSRGAQAVLIWSWNTIQIWKEPKLSSNVTLLLTLEKAALQPGQTVGSFSLLKCYLFCDEVSTNAILSNLFLSWILLCRWWFPSLSTREVESGQAELTWAISASNTEPINAAFTRNKKMNIKLLYPSF